MYLPKIEKIQIDIFNTLRSYLTHYWSFEIGFLLEIQFRTNCWIKYIIKICNVSHMIYTMKDDLY